MEGYEGSLTPLTEKDVADIIEEERAFFNVNGPAKSLSETWSRKAARRILTAKAEPNPFAGLPGRAHPTTNK